MTEHEEAAARRYRGMIEVLEVLGPYWTNEDKHRLLISGISGNPDDHLGAQENS